MSLTAFLTTIVRLLNEAGIPHMLTGSLAAAYYGTPRATQDVDLVIEPEESALEGLIDLLLAEELYVSRDAAREALRGAGQFNIIDVQNGWKADLIVRKARPFNATEFERRAPARLLGVEVALATLEDLILAKLEWSELGDSDLQRRDIDELLRRNWEDLDRRYIEEWAERLNLIVAWTKCVERHGEER